MERDSFREYQGVSRSEEAHYQEDETIWWASVSDV